MVHNYIPILTNKYDQKAAKAAKRTIRSSIAAFCSKSNREVNSNQFLSRQIEPSHGTPRGPT